MINPRKQHRAPQKPAQNARARKPRGPPKNSRGGLRALKHLFTIQWALLIKKNPEWSLNTFVAISRANVAKLQRHAGRKKAAGQRPRRLKT
jgi:hypothetical protein